MTLKEWNEALDFADKTASRISRKLGYNSIVSADGYSSPTNSQMRGIEFIVRDNRGTSFLSVSTGGYSNAAQLREAILRDEQTVLERCGLTITASGADGRQTGGLNDDRDNGRAD